MAGKKEACNVGPLQASGCLPVSAFCTVGYRLLISIIIKTKDCNL
jgi:hypothetical protein